MIDPDDLAIHIRGRGPWLYHATPSGSLASILRDGIRPGSELGRFNATNPFHRTRPGHVYLWAAKEHDRLRGEVGDATLRVDIRQLDPAAINPDEDLVQINWHRSEPGEEWIEADPPFFGPNWEEGPNGEDTLAYWAETTPGFDAPEITAKSLASGRVAYQGTIPPSALEALTWPPGAPRS